MDAQFGAQSAITIELRPPYTYEPPKTVNEFGIPERTPYRTADVAKILKISASAIQWRLRQGWYPEIKKDSAGRRIFNLNDIRAMLNGAR